MNSVGEVGVDEAKGLSQTMIALLIVVPFLLLLVAAAFYFSRRWLQDIKVAVNEVEKEFGFVNLAPSGIYPNLRGRVDGIEVFVDVIFQHYMWSSGASGKRPFTRVRAPLMKPHRMQICSRHQRCEGSISDPAHQTGDEAFDARYLVYSSDLASLEEELPAKVRSVFATLDPPVHLMKNSILWGQTGVIRDGKLLRSAILSCARAAAALENRS